MLTLARNACYKGWKLCSFPLYSTLWVARRHSTAVPPAQLSEDRAASWCRRLWALAQGSSNASTIRRNPTFCGLELPLGKQGIRGEVTLVEEMKSALSGRRGQLPPSVVAAVWDVYESIIPPWTLCDLSGSLCPWQEDAFFTFVALLVELDVNISEVRVAAEHLSNAIQRAETICAEPCEPAAVGGSRCNAAGSGAMDSDSCGVGRSIACSKLVKAKNDLLRQCVAVLHAGSPVYYMWFMQSASVERGVRRLMDLRRCVAYFQGKCGNHVSSLQAEIKLRQGQRLPGQHREDPLGSDLVALKEKLERWLVREHHLSSIDVSLEYLFSDLFSKQWLVMEELTWHTTPPFVLEKVMTAESVHPFAGGLADMKHRLQPAKDRHLFAFFHPAVVEEPLIAVQVALTRGIAHSVDAVLGRPCPPCIRECQERSVVSTGAISGGRKEMLESDVNTATFYSINSAQSALRGVNLGNLLIKRVVQEVEARLNMERRRSGFSQITTFCTISPIPGYSSWLVGEVGKLRQQVQTRGKGASLGVSEKFARHRIFGECSTHKTDEIFLSLRNAILCFARRRGMAHEGFISRLQCHLHGGSEDAANLLTMQFLLTLFGFPGMYMTDEGHAPRAVADRASEWWSDAELTRVIEKPILQSIAHYLYREKRRNRVLDAVGNFHISNGAMMFRLNFLANCTPGGSRQGATVMVNYLYEPACVDERVKAYETHRTVPIGADIQRLLSTS